MINPTQVNPWRGEMDLVLAGQGYCLRPSFTAIVAAEKELGGLVGLALDAADGKVGFSKISLFLWHLLDTPEDVKLTREEFGGLLLEEGVARAAEIFRDMLTIILNGRPEQDSCDEQGRD